MWGVFTLLYGLIIEITLAQHTHDRSELYSLLGYPDTEPSPTADHPGNDQYYQPPNRTAQGNGSPVPRVNQNPITHSQPVAHRQTYTDQWPMMPQMAQSQPVATSQLQPQQMIQPQPVATSQLQPQHMAKPQPVARSQLQPQQYMQSQAAVQPGFVQPIAQTQPFMQMQPLPQTQSVMQMQPGVQTQPIYQPRPTNQPRYFQLVAQPPMTMQTHPLMQHRYMQPVVPTQQYLQSQPFIQPRYILTQPQQYVQRQPSMPAHNVMPAAATPFLQTQKQQMDKQANVKLAGQIVPTMQSNQRRHQSPHIPSAPRTNHRVIYGSRVPLYFFQHPSNIG